MIEQTCLDEVLLESAKEVFETMIFMDLVKTTEPDQNIGEDNALISSITFDGDLKGCLSIHLGMLCAKNIAINMLGMELGEEIDEADIYDAIGEVANMVMGNVKARLQDDIGSINVSIPNVVSGQKLRHNLGEGMFAILARVSIEDEYIADLSLSYRENSK